MFVYLSAIGYFGGGEDRLRNDLYCVEWGVKLYSNQPTLREHISGTARPVFTIFRACHLCHTATSSQLDHPSFAEQRLPASSIQDQEKNTAFSR